MEDNPLNIEDNLYQIINNQFQTEE